MLRFFPDNQDTMVQALKAGELDYAHDVTADQFKQLQADPAYTAVAGAANGWTQLAFNTYGTGTGKTIEGGGPSTKALLDPAFRDALGYAVDKDELVDRVLGGFGDVGSTIVPPVLSDWHVDPDKPRTFDIDDGRPEAHRRRVSEADASGKRLDKEGKPISLSLVYPDTEDAYAKAAQFVQEWYGQLGSTSRSRATTATRSRASSCRPTGWQGRIRHRAVGLGRQPGSQRPAQVFRCDQIGIVVRQPVLQPDVRRPVRQAVQGVG